MENNGSEYQRSNYFSGNPLKNFAHRYPLNIILGLLEEKEYDKIIDIGCADGIILPSLSRHCKELYALDLQTNFFEYIKKYGLPNLSMVEGDVCSMKFKDGTFDVVLCLETLEHVHSPKKAISEIKRVLKKGGTGVVSIPIEIGPSLFVKQFFRLLAGYANCEGGYSARELFDAAILMKPNEEWHKGHLGHKGFDYRTVLRDIKESGLEVERVHYLPISFLGPAFGYRVIIKFSSK